MTGAMRVAVFVDFENLISTLKKRSQRGIGDYGESPRINFERLADTIRENFGALDPQDFVVVANFTHYNPQLGGLNRLARLVYVDSFEPRRERNTDPATAGKKHVIRNFCDMRLAYEVGLHLAMRPAGMYIFITGDSSFAAIAGPLKDERGRHVRFILPDPDSAGVSLKENFEWTAFEDFCPLEEDVPEIAPVAMDAPPEQDTSIYAALRQALKTFRREFSTAIPAALVRALLGTAPAARLLSQAAAAGVVDLWDDPNATACVSLKEERVHSTVVKMPVRPSFARCAQILAAMVEYGETQVRPITRADWRGFIKDRGGFSNSEAKRWLDWMFEQGILLNERLNKPKLTLENVTTFIRTVEQVEK